MNNARASAFRAGVLATVSGSCALGCTPTVDVFGVYFPGWLVSAVVGLGLVVAGTTWLARIPGARMLAQSGVFFCSLTAILSMLVWWLFFSSW